jgi:hypothetical protein
MAIVKVHFLAVDTPGNVRSVRQRNLNRAEALSHAATISHLRAGRGILPTEDEDDKQKVLGTTEANRRPARKGQRSSYHNKAVQKQRGQHQGVVVQMKTGVLDPFIKLPINLSARDRQLLHVCEWKPRACDLGSAD